MVSDLPNGMFDVNEEEMSLTYVKRPDNAIQEYFDKIKEKADKCEKNHKVLETAVIVGEYKSIGSIPDGCPYKIKVKFNGSDKWIEYKR